MEAAERRLSPTNKSCIDLLYLSITASYLDQLITDWVQQVHSFITVSIFKLHKSLAEW